MGRVITVYGIIAGIIVVVGMRISMAVVTDHGMMGMVAGYLAMLVALSFVFVGVKRYRDMALGGVIRFTTALWIGLGIACVAALFYVLSWEVYMWQTGGTFMNEYSAQAIENLRTSGASPEKVAQFSAEMADFAKQYANPLFRMPMTFMEIAPVGLIVALISAAVLRKSTLLPATEPRA